MSFYGQRKLSERIAARLSWDAIVYYFFRGNATVAIIVVALIIVFLWREGVDFFPEHRRHLELYRESGGELVDFLLVPLRESQELLNEWNDWYQKQKGSFRPERSIEEVNNLWHEWWDHIYATRLAADPMIQHVMKVRQRAKVAEEAERRKRRLVQMGRKNEAELIKIEPVDWVSEEQKLRQLCLNFMQDLQHFRSRMASLRTVTETWLMQQRLQASDTTKLRSMVSKLRAIEERCANIDSESARKELKEPVGHLQALSAFLLGQYWITQSFWMDWYGLLPVLGGSALVCIIALTIAVPIGVGSAIYVNQFASALERDFIKPSLEFIAAIPSVVLGFFGIVVLGETLREISQSPLLSWLPGFPFNERLNALTAGCLLAFMAVPTIFSLAEDALQNVPGSYKEGAFALGATKMQAVWTIIIPAASSGIIAAILLGLGRVIGETMVVLLCAGNRLMLPDFGSGLGVLTQPVHTMTGLIAQEMPEVVRGSLHYRALFVIGLTLFIIALLINFSVQRLLRSYQKRE
ncbi:MAG: phosphate ABC transporter permease subunit PstC [Methylacidiphilales bacterium]|nr:phosphate ABC transporter permease subunit PstC [Candidatus Methylacidiphilales bacterium]MDW8348773.1 phosphate ABC transporter permease subunit PstC [Verrucomicrobiae bacterium]